MTVPRSQAEASRRVVPLGFATTVPLPAEVPVMREGEGVANPATIRNQRKRRDEPRMLGKPVKLERFDRPGRPEADAAGSRRP